MPRRPPRKKTNSERLTSERKTCRIDGCEGEVFKNNLCETHDDGVQRCTVSGCLNYSRRKGLCIAHGAVVKRKICSHEGCSKFVQKEGKCNAHGQLKKRCLETDCKNQAVKHGVCIKHGALKKRCSMPECDNQVVKQGLCCRHLTTAGSCSVSDCTFPSVTDGLCVKHGAKCSAEGCAENVFREGHCFRHCPVIKKCKVGDCQNRASKNGVCIEHGAQVYKCVWPSCSKRVKSPGLCPIHTPVSLPAISRMQQEGYPNEQFSKEGDQPPVVTSSGPSRSEKESASESADRCSIVSCERLVVSRGMCALHRKRPRQAALARGEEGKLDASKEQNSSSVGLRGQQSAPAGKHSPEEVNENSTIVESSTPPLLRRQSGSDKRTGAKKHQTTKKATDPSQITESADDPQHGPLPLNPFWPGTKTSEASTAHERDQGISEEPLQKPKSH